MSVITKQQNTSLRAEFFNDRMHSMLSEASSALMVSIGHRCGLFRALDELDWTSAEDLATATGMSEHYIASWLACMASAGILETDADCGRYRIPAEHLDALVGDSPRNVAVLMQQVALLGSVEGLVADAFSHRRGVHPREYRRFQAISGELSRGRIASRLDEVISFVPGLLKKLERGIIVLEAGCGSGELLAALASRFPRSRFLGIDISDEAIRRARKLQLRNGSSNLHFEQRNVMDGLMPGQYDLVIACGVIRESADPHGMIARLHECLSHDGSLLVREQRRAADIAAGEQDRLEAYLHTYECMVSISHSMAVNGSAADIVRDDAGLRRMLQQGGFRNMRSQQLDNDVLGSWTTAEVGLLPAAATEHRPRVQHSIFNMPV